MVRAVPVKKQKMEHQGDERVSVSVFEDQYNCTGEARFRFGFLKTGSGGSGLNSWKTVLAVPVSRSASGPGPSGNYGLVAHGVSLMQQRLAIL